jgi:hypothetical protein
VVITERTVQMNVPPLRLPFVFVCDVIVVNGAVDGNTVPNDAMRKFVGSDVRLGEGRNVAFFFLFS